VIVRALRRRGLVIVRQAEIASPPGTWSHPDDGAGHSPVVPGTPKSILRQAEISLEELLAAL
jgi:hypothetical protein